MSYGFIRVAAAVPSLRVADCAYNVEQMLPLIAEAENNNVDVILFPELGITSYSCGDLFLQPTIVKGAESALAALLDFSKQCDVIIIAGLPVAYGSSLLDCAVVARRGNILGAVPKKYICNHHGCSEKRWFVSSRALSKDAGVTLCGQSVALHKNQIFRTRDYAFAIEMGEDFCAPVPASSLLTAKGAELVFVPAASSETAGKYDSLVESFKQQSARAMAGYVYSACGYGESSGDTVFAGNAFIAENGKMIEKGERFSKNGQLLISEIDVEKLRFRRMNNSTFGEICEEYKDVDVRETFIDKKANELATLTRKICSTPFIPAGDELASRCQEIFNIQAAGLAKRIEHTRSATCVIGISGGLDSTLALLVTVRAFDILGKERKGIVAVTMPGFGTTDRTYNNAIELMKSLGATIREISIKNACLQHFEDIGHDVANHDVTYENSQARERTQILMDIANQANGLVVGTGDLSELALGWATYNGDHMSMYGVNASVPKTLIQHIVKQIAASSDDEKIRTTLLDIVETPISPELIPADEQGNIKQKTEDLVGPYELHDFFLYHFVCNGFAPAKIFFMAQRAFCGIYDRETIKKWLTTFCRRFFIQQFKRSCMPDGPKVGNCSLSPRGDWKMPTDACSALWLAECDTL
ncbi:MAG: NAD(+) synthase [Bacteroidaceae bacterium]|nr:NAD(+) synthase [Bacteroidaceae bacterium]